MHLHCVQIGAIAPDFLMSSVMQNLPGMFLYLVSKNIEIEVGLIILTAQFPALVI